MTHHHQLKRLWNSRLYRRPHSFLEAQADQQGDRIWFQEPGARWLVIHHPDDVAELASLPQHVADGSSVKRSLVPWLTADILPGMGNDDFQSGREEFASRLEQLRKQDLQAYVERTTRLLDVSTAERKINFSNWCAKAAVDFGNSLYSDRREIHQCYDVCATADPIGWSPLASRWLTSFKMRSIYSRFSRAVGCRNDEHRYYRREFLLYTGFVVNIASALRHVFSQLLREGSHVCLQLGSDISPSCRRDLSKATCNESLRRAPPLVFIIRQLTEDIEFGGLQLKRGMVIAACPFLTHRREDVFESPLAFSPEHFANNAVYDATRYYPFGFGERSCPVNLLARDILAWFVEHITANFALRLEGSRENPITFSKSLLTTTRRHHDYVWIKKRS